MSDLTLKLRITADGGQARAEITGLDGKVVELGVDTADAGKKARAAGDNLDHFGKRAKASSEIVSGLVKRVGALGLGYMALRTALGSFGVFRTFQASISDLSAITGATGKDLAYMTAQARQMGATTVYTASQAAEAFKLIASAKPDLLGNAKALAEVTKQTLTLAEASGSTLPDAAKTVGSALNQFSANADQAGRFVNVLAAGAKYGASEIADTAQALKVSGTVAAAAGLSFEQTNAAIQAMAAVALKGADAGTGLRGVLLKLQNQIDGNFNPSIVGLSQALINLNKANLSSADMTKLFGIENVTAAHALMKNADSIAGFTAKLTGTNTAAEQASIKINNLDGDLKQLDSAWQNQQITIMSEFNPAIRTVIQGLTQVISSSKQTKDQLSASKDSANQLALTFGDLADIAGNAAHGIELPFQAVGGAIAALSGQIVAVLHGDFSVAKNIGEQYASDMEAKFMAMTDPVIASRFEDNAKRMIAASKAVSAAVKSDSPAAVKNKAPSPAGHSIALPGNTLNQADSLIKSMQQKFASADEKMGNDYVALYMKLQRIGAAGTGKLKELQSAYGAWIDQYQAKLDADIHKKKVKATTTALAQLIKSQDTARGVLETALIKRGQMLANAYDLGLISESRMLELSDKVWTKHERDLTALQLREQHKRLQQQRTFQNNSMALQQSFSTLGQNASRISIRALTAQLAAFHTSSVGFEKMTATQKLGIVQGGLAAMSGLMSSHNRAQFELGKAAALGNAVVNIAEGVTKAWSMGPIMGPIFAGIIVAAGAAQIAAISNAKMGSSAATGASMPSYGGSGAQPVVPINASTGAAQTSGTGAAQQIAQLHLVVTGDNGAAIANMSDHQLQQIGAKLAPVIQANFSNNTHMTVMA